MEYTNDQETVDALQVTFTPAPLLQWLTAGGWANRGTERVLREGGVVILFDDGLHVVPVGDYLVKRPTGFERVEQAVFEAEYHLA